MRLWQIRDNQPKRIARGSLDLEARLENWLRDDIGMVSDYFLVIGQQVETEYGGIIDLLAIDKAGDLVILELKKDKTPRQIVAQALDYASWVQEMGHEDVVECASDFFRRIGKNISLEQAFKDKFDENLPNVINESHRIYIVASSLDSATERIVKYLSETHRVDINAATFTYFDGGDDELIGCSMLLDEKVVQTRAQTRSSSRRRRTRNQGELREVAKEHGVVDLWDKAIRGLRPMVDGIRTSWSTISLNVRIDASNLSALSILPEESSSQRGLLLRIRHDVVSGHFKISEEELRHICGPVVEDIVDSWGGTTRQVHRGSPERQ